MGYCVFCGERKGVPLHRFPNPKTRPGMCAAWIKLLSNRKIISPLWAYVNLKVCSFHFKSHEIMSGHRISVDAIPSKYLDGEVPRSNINKEHNYCNAIISVEPFNSPLKEECEALMQSSSFDNMHSPEYIDDIWEDIDFVPEVSENKDLRSLGVTNCRTCLDIITSEYVNLEDEVDLDEEYNLGQPINLIEMLVSLGCIEELGDDNWPHNVCKECVTKITVAYKFKMTCLNSTTKWLSHLSANAPQNSTDINDITDTRDSGEGPYPKLEEIDVDYLNLITPDLPEFNNEEIKVIDSPIIKAHETKKKIKTQKGVRKKVACKSKLSHKHKPYLKNLSYKHIRPEENKIQQYDIGSPGHTCNRCGENYETKSMLKNHIRIKHSEYYYKSLCNVCGNNKKSHDDLCINKR